MKRFETIRSGCRFVDSERLWFGRAQLTSVAVRITGWLGLKRYVRRVLLNDILAIGRPTGSFRSNIEFRLADGSVWSAAVSAPGLWSIEAAQRMREIRPILPDEEDEWVETSPRVSTAEHLSNLEARIAEADSYGPEIQATDDSMLPEPAFDDGPSSYIEVAYSLIEAYSAPAEPEPTEAAEREPEPEPVAEPEPEPVAERVPEPEPVAELEPEPVAEPEPEPEPQPAPETTVPVPKKVPARGRRKTAGPQPRPGPAIPTPAWQSIHLLIGDRRPFGWLPLALLADERTAVA